MGGGKWPSQLNTENGAGSMRLDEIPAPPEQRESAPVTPSHADDSGYDEIDRRLIDTFPASDAVARY